jgi:hypothetical protein
MVALLDAIRRVSKVCFPALAKVRARRRNADFVAGAGASVDDERDAAVLQRGRVVVFCN